MRAICQSIANKVCNPQFVVCSLLPAIRPADKFVTQRERVVCGRLHAPSRNGAREPPWQERSYAAHSAAAPHTHALSGGTHDAAAHAQGSCATRAQVCARECTTWEWGGLPPVAHLYSPNDCKMFE